MQSVVLEKDVQTDQESINRNESLYGHIVAKQMPAMTLCDTGSTVRSSICSIESRKFAEPFSDCWPARICVRSAESLPRHFAVAAIARIFLKSNRRWE